MDEKYSTALGVCAAALGIKIVLTTLGTVRARLASGQAYDLEEDKTPLMQFMYGYVFKAMFLVCPLGLGDDDDEEAPEAEAMVKRSDPLDADDPCVVTLRALHRNAMEQEPFFMAVAVVFGLVYPGECYVAIYSAYIFAICRWVHWLTYLCHLQPFRSLSFIGGLICTLIMSINMIYRLLNPDKSTVTASV